MRKQARKQAFAIWGVIMGFGRYLPASLCVVALAITGCGTGPTTPTHHPIGDAQYSGSVHGGQQPVVGATIQLYTVGTTADGSVAPPLLTSTVTSGPDGTFTITGLYSCTNATQVYIVAAGGNPGLSTANPNIALMAALGPCSSLTPSTFISINELTTAAAVSALAPFMTSATAIGSSSSDASALAAAFTLANQLVDTTTGASPGTGAPSGDTVPSAELNTLADILSACINSSGGTAGDGSLCGQLFSLTTVSPNPAPINTIAAMLNIADNPTLNTSALYALAPPTPPFEPTLTSVPPDFRVRLAPPAGSLVLQISPSSIVFPDTAATFTSQPQTVTIQNTGSTSVTFNSIATIGANASDFAVSNNSCGASLSAAGTCTVQVTATPSANGARNAYLAINSTSPNSPQYVALSVNGTAPSAGPVTLTSSASFNVLGAFIDLTLANTGTTPLNIKSITESDAGQPVYFTVAQTTCGTTLPAQSSCIITAHSSATPRNGSPTTVTGTITVTDDAAAGPQTSSLTSADSVQIQTPETYFSNGYAGFVIFPTNHVGYTQTAVALTYAPLFSSPTAPPIPLTISGADAGDFGITAQDSPGTGTNTSCPSTYTLTTDCLITVTFTPTTTGTRTAQLSMDPATGTPTGQYVQLTGSAVAPGPYFVINTSSITTTSHVPTSDPGSTGITNLTLTNIGTTTIDLAASFTGANPSYMTANISSCSSVASEATCSFTVTFSAPAAGNYSANLVLKDANSSFSLSIPISATTNWWPVGVSPSTLSFGNQPVGSTSTKQYFYITDGSGISLDHSITASLQPNSNFTLPNGSTCAAGALSPCSLTVAFAPQAAGSDSEYVTITDQTSGLQAHVQLTGTGVSPDYTLSAYSVAFPPQNVGTSSTTSVTLTNVSNHSITVSGISVIGAQNGNFTETNNCSAVAINGTCSINITFVPIAGMQSASIQITSNASNSVPDIYVSGTGQ